MKYVLVLVLGLLGAGCKGEGSSNLECKPQCDGRTCGPDGCGDVCGLCGPGLTCDNAGVCLSSFCGNGEVDNAESCDPAITEGTGVCPTACEDDGNACTNENFFGTAENCDARCAPFAIINCDDGDGCCPSGCSPMNDLDCSENCDNGVVDEGEACDPPSSCPVEADCDDNNVCTTDRLTGSALNCSAQCANIPVTECIDGDGCCAPGCDATEDDDCTTTCGDGLVGDWEACDRGIEGGLDGACPANAGACDDADACTTEDFDGRADRCTATCNRVTITACAPGDGCCPPSCSGAMDTDCASACTTFCTAVLAACTDVNQVYVDEAACLTACESMAVGLPSDTDTDTVSCRLGYAQMAATDPATLCPYTAADGGGMCVN